MKRLFITLSVLLATLMPLGVATSSAGAVNVLSFCNSTTNAGKTDVCKDQKKQNPKENPIIGLIKTAIQIFAFIIGAAAVIVIIVSGLNLVTAGGDPQKAANARKGITYAVIGLAIAAMSQAIVSLVLGGI